MNRKKAAVSHTECTNARDVFNASVTTYNHDHMIR